MTKLAIIGCGVIGAILAYELSCAYPNDRNLTIHVFDRHPPTRGVGATGAALGLMIGALSLKNVKSRAWKLRRDSVQRYATLIPELEAKTGRSIPHNRHGILKLCTEWKPTLEKWQQLAEIRREDHFRLDILTPEIVAQRFPELNVDRTLIAIHSLDDPQVEPIPLVEAVIAAARSQGVIFDFDAQLEACNRSGDCGGDHSGDRVESLTLRRGSGVRETVSIDGLILTAGAGSAAIAQSLDEPLTIVNVLGQALHMQPRSPLSPTAPVVTCDDIHVVPRTDGTLWVGATVEFPPEESGCDPEPDPEGLDRLLAQASVFYPGLREAQILDSWQGMRPRPVGRSTPVIEPLSGLTNVLLATAHYRNGVLLAPATAQQAIEYLKTMQVLDA